MEGGDFGRGGGGGDVGIVLVTPMVPPPWMV